jgi:hypothetical protein
VVVWAADELRTRPLGLVRVHGSASRCYRLAPWWKHSFLDFLLYKCVSTRSRNLNR